jgi:predicted transcriptional regulator
MKEWIVIHKVKSLYNNGQGLSQREIAKELGISRNIVRKYLNLDETSITILQDDTSR